MCDLRTMNEVLEGFKIQFNLSEKPEFVKELNDYNEEFSKIGVYGVGASGHGYFYYDGKEAHWPNCNHYH